MATINRVKQQEKMENTVRDLVVGEEAVSVSMIRKKGTWRLLEEMLLRIRRRRALSDIVKNNFWFIDIPRTSSSSIKSEISIKFGSVYGKRNLLEKEYSVSSVFRDHLTAQEMRSIVGKEKWKQMFSFTLVRNPWERMVSLYQYRIQKGNLDKKVSFRDYIREFDCPRYTLLQSAHSRPAYYYGQAEFVVDRDGNIIVGFIGKYENREKDLNFIGERIGIPTLGKRLFIQRGAVDRGRYAKYYDEETAHIVGRVFEKDREMFQYEFEK